MTTLPLILALVLFEPEAKPTKPHECHAHDVDTRGDAAMGFSHETTTHHFQLKKDGGAIEVTARYPKDGPTIARIRTHLRHIRTAFTEGDFALPGFIHAKVPPGVEVMKSRRELIQYTYVENPHGGTVRITTRDPDARAAVHRFLKFQIEDHRTGDSGLVEE
jgi:hypothetical protein